MRPGGGKQKGSAFERQVCKDLSFWVSAGERGDIFWRSAMSGGRSTVALKKGERLSAQAGDISAIDALGHAFIERFMVEAKFYRTLNLEGLVKGTGKLLAFWERTVHDAKFHKKVPILIAKQNHCPILFCTNEKGLHLLNIDRRAFRRLEVPPYNLHILLFDDILEQDVHRTRIYYYDYNLALRDYRSHKNNARRRGIEFRFTFNRWVTWWEHNLGPQWQRKRGHLKGQYVMARKGDTGPYAPWNVKCIPHEENAKERGTNGSAARGEKVSTNKLTEEQVVSIFHDKRGLTTIAREYGVDKTNVWQIKTGKTWKHVTGPLLAKKSKKRVRL